jgi:hypothetical protein
MANPANRIDPAGLYSPQDYHRQYEENQESIKELEAEVQKEFATDVGILLIPGGDIIEALKHAKDICDIKQKLDLWNKYQALKRGQQNIVKDWRANYGKDFNNYFSPKNGGR